MKKITKFLMAVAVISISAFTQARAQVDIGVSLQLHRPAQYENNERVHPPRPSVAHRWIAEEWVWNGGTYAYHPGYWAVPPRPNAVWVPGSWRHRLYGRPGYRWKAGFWKYY